jgi:two-component system invasion response regulator UvrY
LAQCGEEAVRRCASGGIDLVVMDVVMPGMGGLEAARRIKQMEKPPRVIIISFHDGTGYRDAAEDAGADAYCPKGELQTTLLPAIARVLGVPDAPR